MNSGHEPRSVKRRLFQAEGTARAEEQQGLEGGRKYVLTQAQGRTGSLGGEEPRPRGARSPQVPWALGRGAMDSPERFLSRAQTFLSAL